MTLVNQLRLFSTVRRSCSHLSRMSSTGSANRKRSRARSRDASKSPESRHRSDRPKNVDDRTLKQTRANPTPKYYNNFWIRFPRSVRQWINSTNG